MLSAGLYITWNMNQKLLTVFTFISQIFTIASQEKPKQLAILKFQSEFECVPNILSFMNFRYNYKCVQFVRGNGKYSDGCTAKIIQHSHNITFYMRSIPWLLNRNILRDESLRNANKRNSTKSCENFLIFLDDVNSLKSIVKAATINSNATAVLFAFSKLYFIFEDRNYLLNNSVIKTLSQLFYEKSHFGYIFEFNSDTNRMQLRDLLTLQITETKRRQRNLIHPFVDRQNRNKQFRVRFSHCYPYVIIEDAVKQRWNQKLNLSANFNWNFTFISDLLVLSITYFNK